MRVGMDGGVLAALAAQGITTAIVARLDFKSETVCVWTGQEALPVAGSGDTLLDNQTYEPLVHGVVLDIGENNMSMSGSASLTISLGLPADVTTTISAAMVAPDEYQARQATLWRALRIENAVPGVPVKWAFRRIRTGRMDHFEVHDDGSNSRLILTIEGHAGLISNATNQTYQSQKALDPTDTSQDYVLACANGSPAPSKSSPSQSFGGSGGGGGYDGRQYNYVML